MSLEKERKPSIRTGFGDEDVLPNGDELLPPDAPQGRKVSVLGVEVVDRGQWSGPLDFLMSMIAYAVGLGMHNARNQYECKFRKRVEVPVPVLQERWRLFPRRLCNFLLPRRSAYLHHGGHRGSIPPARCYGNVENVSALQRYRFASTTQAEGPS